GEDEPLGLGEGFGGVPAAVALPDDGRVKALLDRRPDGEDRGKGVALHEEVAAVPDVDLVDLVEEMLGCVRSEDVREPRVHAAADKCELAACLPAVGRGELLVA